MQPINMVADYSTAVELSQMLHDERNLNCILKRNINSIKINLYQERLRVQHLQILNEKLAKQHKSDIKRINSLLPSEEDKEELNDTTLVDIEEHGSVALEHYENLIKVLQDQVEMLLDDRDTAHGSFMQEFIACQSHIKYLNSEFANLESSYKESADSLEIHITKVQSLKEENKTLRKTQEKILKVRQNNICTESKNTFLNSENNYYKNQIKVLENTVNRLKNQRSYLLNELRALKNKIIELKEYFNNKIQRLSREICFARYKSTGLKCKDSMKLKYRNCICEELEMNDV